MPPIRALCCALALSLAAALPASAEPVRIRATPIERFDVARIAGPRFGRLEFLGGLVLRGPRGFGGLSGLHLEGDRLTAVTDRGHVFTARLVLEGERLTGLTDTHLAPRIGADGAPVGRTPDGDAEALTREGDSLLVAVEGSARLLAYPFAGGRLDEGATPSVLTLPQRVASRARRDGLEALATLPSGEVLVFLEGRRGRGDIEGALRENGAPRSIVRRGTFSVTGADALPSGEVFIVERRYDGGIDVGLRIRRIGADRAGGARPFDGPVLLETDLRHEIDNMEAIAAQARGGDIVLTLMSDDNFNFFQRTLLLRFRVADPIPRPKPAPPAG